MCYPIILEVIKRCHIDKNISVIFALSSFFYVLKIKDQGTFCFLVCKLVHVCLFTLFNYESFKFIPSHIFLNYKSIWSDKKVLIIGNCQWRVQVTYRGQWYNLPPLDFVIFGHMMFQKDILNWYIFWYCNTCTIGRVIHLPPMKKFSTCIVKSQCKCWYEINVIHNWIFLCQLKNWGVGCVDK